MPCLVLRKSTSLKVRNDTGRNVVRRGIAAAVQKRTALALPPRLILV